MYAAHPTAFRVMDAKQEYCMWEQRRPSSNKGHKTMTTASAAKALPWKTRSPCSVFGVPEVSQECPSMNAAKRTAVAALFRQLFITSEEDEFDRRRRPRP